MVKCVQALVGVGAVAALIAAGLVGAPVTAQPAPDGPSLTLRPGFVGVPAGVTAHDPGVTSATPAETAALSHVDRYAATLGVDPDQLVARGVTRTVAGTDAVRFTQQVDGVPVIGGEVVVGLRADRELDSAQATVSRLTRVDSPVVAESAAADTALTVTARAAGVSARTLAVRSGGRWLLDPRVLGAPARLGTHTVWRFDVADGAAVRRLVLVDVRTGGVVMSLDAIQQIDRVVCDNQNVPVEDATDCSSGFARTEASGATGVADVDQAFLFSGAVSEFYDEIGGIDLTDALGVSVGGVKKLASTVRLCIVDQPCPYPNAFWNGRGMYYGADYASADDVVGHEMTHGIIDQNSALFYWGQSGAINESIADTMGEILDHRNPSPGDSATDWRMGEDLPIGALRDLEDPTMGGDPNLAAPDSMTSQWYVADLDYQDNGGVHTNSGVGNKTAYLISQGGTFKGQTITGLDVGDPTLTRTATLYLQVLQMLSSGSDYADLAAVLDQSCQALVGGPAGITTTSCVNVHKAGLATRLTTTPTNARQPTDAPASCPRGATKRVLLDGESGDPEAMFTPGPTWSRGGNATSGVESWYSEDPASVGASSLATASPVTLPVGQKSYLWFQHWRLLDFDTHAFYDGGVVEINGHDAGALPWVNGPEDVLSTEYGNPAGGVVSFSGNSLGFVASRVDLTSYAGSAVTPSFTLFSDSDVSFYGWYVDDIRVYTCDPGIANAQAPTITGQAKVGKKLTVRPGTWSPSGLTFTYAWLRNGKAIAAARTKIYHLKSADRGRKISVRVTARTSGLSPVSVTSAQVGPVR